MVTYVLSSKVGIDWLSADPAVADCDVALAWHAPAVASGPTPPPRYRHSATALEGGRSVLVLGGRDATSVFSDAWLLRIASRNSVSWERVALRGAPFPPTFSHSAVAQGGTVFVVGGYPAADASCVSSQVWGLALDSCGSAAAALPPTEAARSEPREATTALACDVVAHPSCRRGRASHAACILDARWLVVVGGVLDGQTPWSRDHHTEIFDTSSSAWLGVAAGVAAGVGAGVGAGVAAGGRSNALPLADALSTRAADSGASAEARAGAGQGAGASGAAPEAMMMKHTVSVVGDGVLSLGGGAMCGTFEQCYAPAFRLSSIELTAWTRYFSAVTSELGAGSGAGSGGGEETWGATARAAAFVPPAAARGAPNKAQHVQHALLVPKRHTKSVKTALGVFLFTVTF